MDFAPESDAQVAPLGHDEDGDGVPDELDVCPHIADDQTDTDGDHIGDACDPRPNTPTEHLVLFASMTPGDQPLAPGGTGAWTQRADAIAFDGNRDGGLTFPGTFHTVRVAVGIDILGATNGNQVQHQIALATITPIGTASRDFTEINELPGFSRAAITHFDGTSYSSVTTATLPSSIHPGYFTLQSSTDETAQTIVLDGGWVGEPYHLAAPTSVPYHGASQMFLGIENLMMEVRWIWIVTSD